MASPYKKKRDKGKKGACYYVDYTDEYGHRRTVKGFTDKGESKDLGLSLEKEARRRRRGLVDPQEVRAAEHRRRPIQEHLEAFERSLSDTTVKHTKLTLSRVKLIVAGCSFTTIGEVTPELVRDFLNKDRKLRKLGARTYNHYLQAFDEFCNWLVKMNRLTANPISSLDPLNTEVDIRHKRRALTEDEVKKLVNSARNSDEVIQCFDGEQRARIYLLSFMTGLRRKEIASLTPASFDLDGVTPKLTVEAACSKHRRKDELALHPELVTLLKAWLRDVPTDQALFPKLANRRTWLMVKKDLERVGIPYENEKGIADFHAAGRHSYVTNLARAGVPLAEVRKLARHEDIHMTVKYTHTDLEDQARALRGLDCQWIGSVLGVPNCLSESPNGTVGEQNSSVKKRQNPGGDQGCDAACQSVSPAVAGDEKWRQQNIN